MKSKLISISAIAAAFNAILLTLGAYFEFVDLFALALSSIFVILPLYYKSYLASVLTYLVGGVVAIIFSGFNFTYSVVFPAYFGFFGLYPIIRCLMYDKNLNVYVGHAIRLIWLVGSFYAIYFYYTLVMRLPITDLPTWVQEGILYLIGGISVIFYFVFDKFTHLAKVATDKYLQKIIK